MGLISVSYGKCGIILENELYNSFSVGRVSDLRDFDMKSIGTRSNAYTTIDQLVCFY